MGGIITLEYEKKWENVTPDGVWNGNTPVAVKTLKEGTSADFLAEANFMKRFRHERLLQPYAVCSDRVLIYIVTKLMPNGSSLDYLKDGTGKDTKLTTHVDRGAHITIAKKSNEKECDNVPPDDGGMVKEGPIEAANENTNLLCPLKKEEELKETDQNAALGEQNTSLPPASNNKTCITKLAGIGPKYMWMLRLILLGILISGANGIKAYLEEGKFRKIIIAPNETQIATDPIEGPNDGSIFAVVAEGGNDPCESFEADSDFVIENQSCYIVVGDKTKTECEGLQIFRNGTHIYLAVNGSKLTRDRTAFYIYQVVPRHFSLYFLNVYKNQDNENPDISGCPSDQSVNTDRCDATAVVTWTPPTATDNSGTQTLTSTNNPGDYFPIGNNTVTYTSTDAAGNTDTCTFYVAVTVNVQREDFRSIAIATSETEVATYSVSTPVDGANYLIYAGNKPGSFKCTPEFVEFNKSCTLEVGDKDKTECEGLQIFRNGTHTHLTVDGSQLTHDYTVFCILQHFPGLHSLYPLVVFKEHDQAPKTNHYKVAFFTLLGIVLLILLVIAIKKNFPWWKKMKQEPTYNIEEGPPSPTVGTTMLSEAERATR